MTSEIRVEQFELVIAADGDAMLSFIGRARIPWMARLEQRALDVLVERGAGLPQLCFAGLRKDDLEILARSERIFVMRAMPGGSTEFTEVAPLAGTGA